MNTNPSPGGQAYGNLHKDRLDCERPRDLKESTGDHYCLHGLVASTGLLGGHCSSSEFAHRAR